MSDTLNSCVRRGSCRTVCLVSMVIFISLVASGCIPEGRGFKLPEGDAEQGKITFVSLGCNDCHSIAGIERNAGSESDVDLRLGGPVSRVKTYGELVTSIINPSHRIARQYPEQPVAVDGESVMRSYNSIMTVEQLVNLVTYLESEYELRVPPSDL